MTYPPPAMPVQPPPNPQKTRLRGRRPLQICIVLAVIGVALLAVGIVASVKSYSAVNGFQRVPITADVPADSSIKTITFSKPGGYVAYYEGSDIDTTGTLRLPPVDVEILKQGGSVPTTLSTPYGHLSGNRVKVLTYDYNGHKGAALYEFHISDPGTYQAIAVYTTPVAGSQIAFGKSIAKDTAIGAGLIVGAILFFVVAIVLLIIGLVKRSRHKKQLAALPPPPGFGMPGGYPMPPGSYPQQGPVAQGFAPPGGYQPPAPGYQPPPTTGYEPPPTGYEPPSQGPS